MRCPKGCKLLMGIDMGMPWAAQVRDHTPCPALYVPGHAWTQQSAALRLGGQDGGPSQGGRSKGGVRRKGA